MAYVLYPFSDSRMFFDRSRLSPLVCLLRLSSTSSGAGADRRMPCRSGAPQSGLQRIPRIAVAARAAVRRVASLTFDVATRGLEPDPDAARSRHSRPAEKRPPARPEFVQTPSQYLRESSFDRLAARGRELAAAVPRYADADRERIRRARQCRAGDLGRARPITARYKLPLRRACA